MKKNKQSLRDLWDHYAHQHIYPKGRAENGAKKNIWTNKGQKFPQLIKNMNLHKQKAQQTPNSINAEFHTKTHYNQSVKNQKTKRES